MKNPTNYFFDHMIIIRNLDLNINRNETKCTKISLFTTCIGYVASNSLKHLIINFASGYKIMEINILLPVTTYGRHAKNKWKNIAKNQTSY